MARFAGLDDVLKTIRTEKPFLFKPADNQQQQQTPPIDGIKPAPANPQQPNNQQATSLFDAVRLQLESQK